MVTVKRLLSTEAGNTISRPLGPTDGVERSRHRRVREDGPDPSVFHLDPSARRREREQTRAEDCQPNPEQDRRRLCSLHRTHSVREETHWDRRPRSRRRRVRAAPHRDPAPVRTSRSGDADEDAPVKLRVLRKEAGQLRRPRSPVSKFAREAPAGLGAGDQLGSAVTAEVTGRDEDPAGEGGGVSEERRKVGRTDHGPAAGEQLDGTEWGCPGPAPVMSNARSLPSTLSTATWTPPVKLGGVCEEVEHGAADESNAISQGDGAPWVRPSLRVPPDEVVARRRFMDRCVFPRREIPVEGEVHGPESRDGPTAPAQILIAQPDAGLHEFAVAPAA